MRVMAGLYLMYAPHHAVRALMRTLYLYVVAVQCSTHVAVVQCSTLVAAVLRSTGVVIVQCSARVATILRCTLVAVVQCRTRVAAVLHSTADYSCALCSTHLVAVVPYPVWPQSGAVLCSTDVAAVRCSTRVAVVGCSSRPVVSRAHCERLSACTRGENILIDAVVR